MSTPSTGPKGKLWGGRFEGATSKDVELYTTSIEIDSRLWRADIKGSLAHARMLMSTEIISQQEGSLILEGLEKIQKEWSQLAEKGELYFSKSAEDIHSEIEKKLYEVVGPVAGKLHTARSRNDQVATALRVYLKDELPELQAALLHLQKWLCDSSESHLETILPGLTHMQHGQPVSLAHHWMAYFWMFERDKGRIQDALKRVNYLPLGSAALAGTSLPIDRQQVMVDLGFEAVCENSLDAVSDRDFAMELVADFAILMSHLSRMAEELILWSTPEFGFIELADSVTTGSSLMPQKKNPDVAELLRGRTGRLNGALVGLLTMAKALPLSYNRDLQEDKFHLFIAYDCVKSSVKILSHILEDAQIKTERMKACLSGDASNATDLADFLVRKGVPFRESHEIVGRIVRESIQSQIKIEDMSVRSLQKFHNEFDESILKLVKHDSVMKARTSEGGTAPCAVKLQIAKARDVLNRV